MKAGVKVAVAVSVWLFLLLPLWHQTILVRRAPLDSQSLLDYESLKNEQIHAQISIAVSCDQVPDLAAATELVLNRELQSSHSFMFFKVSDTCTPQQELCVDVQVGDANVLGLNTSSSRLNIRINEQTMVNGNAADVVAVLLFDHVYKDEAFVQINSFPEVTVKYSPKYHLTFSLLGEGGAVLDWDFTEALEQYMRPFIAEINDKVAQITIDTQTGSYARLGCARNDLIMESDLSTFVDFAEWNLASIVPYQTLNFVFYVPTHDLQIYAKGGLANSFIVPQWGGIYISSAFNDTHRFTIDELRPALQQFSTQLLALLGMREPIFQSEASRASPRLRLAKLSREHTANGLRHAMASLASLGRLAVTMPSIPIPEIVVQRAEVAKTTLSAGLLALKRGDLPLAAREAAQAFQNAEKAFFDKHMVAQAYFPDNQKAVMYMPLIMPLGCVVFLYWLKVLKQRRRN